MAKHLGQSSADSVDGDALATLADAPRSTREGAELMTASTKPGASAVVTREHRLAAWRALRASSYEPPKDSAVGRWIEGLPVSVDTAECCSVAQAIAAAELRGQRSRDAEVERLQRELAELRKNPRLMLCCGGTDEPLQHAQDCDCDCGHALEDHGGVADNHSECDKCSCS